MKIKAKNIRSEQMSYSWDIRKNKAELLFLILGGFFIANALIAEFIGVKVFSVEKTLGIPALNWSFFGYENLSWDMSAGVLLWPIVFVMTDVINEYFGKRGVKVLSFLAVGLILYAFIMVGIAIRLTPADFWPTSHLKQGWTEAYKAEVMKDVGNYDYAFKIVFGQGLWIIAGSICAFLIGQFLDVLVFRKIRNWTGEKAIWLRATGSTLISQLIDSFVVLFIAFFIGAGWDLRLVLAIGCVNYTYKFFMAVLLTPVIYLVHYVIDLYLGPKLAHRLKNQM